MSAVAEINNLLFNKLPSELILNILLQTKPYDIIALSQTSSMIRNFIKDNLEYIILSFRKIHNSRIWDFIIPTDNLDQYFDDFLKACFCARFDIEYKKNKQEQYNQQDYDNTLSKLSIYNIEEKYKIHLAYLYDYHEYIELALYLYYNIDKYIIVIMNKEFVKDVNIFSKYITTILALNKIGFSKFKYNYSSNGVFDILKLNNEDIEYLKNIKINTVKNSIIAPNYTNMIKLLKIGFSVKNSYYKSIDCYIDKYMEQVIELKNVGFKDENIYDFIKNHIRRIPEIIKLKLAKFGINFINNYLRIKKDTGFLDIHAPNNYIKLKEYGFKDNLFFKEILQYYIDDNIMIELKKLKDLNIKDIDCLYSACYKNIVLPPPSPFAFGGGFGNG
jgi:hypothetical protein